MLICHSLLDLFLECFIVYYRFVEATLELAEINEKGDAGELDWEKLTHYLLNLGFSVKPGPISVCSDNLAPHITPDEWVLDR